MWRILKGILPVFVKELNPQLRQNWFTLQFRIRVIKYHTDIWSRQLPRTLSPYEKSFHRRSRSVPEGVEESLYKEAVRKPLKLYNRLKKTLKVQEEKHVSEELSAIHMIQQMFLAKNYLNVIRLSQELLMDSSVPPSYHAAARLYYCSTLLVLNSLEALEKYSQSLPHSKENFRAWQFIALHELRCGRPKVVLKILSDIPFKPNDIITLNLQIQACVHLKRTPEVMLLIPKLVKSHKGQCLCRDTLSSIEQLQGEGTEMMLDRFKRHKKWLKGGNFVIKTDLQQFMIQEINLKKFLEEIS